MAAGLNYKIAHKWGRSGSTSDFSWFGVFGRSVSVWFVARRLPFLIQDCAYPYRLYNQSKGPYLPMKTTEAIDLVKRLAHSLGMILFIAERPLSHLALLVDTVETT